MTFSNLLLLCLMIFNRGNSQAPKIIQCKQCNSLEDTDGFESYKDLGKDCTTAKPCPAGSITCLIFNVKGVKGEVRACSSTKPLDAQAGLAKCATKIKVTSLENFKAQCLGVKFIKPDGDDTNCLKEIDKETCEYRHCYQSTNIDVHVSTFGEEKKLVKCKNKDDVCVVQEWKHSGKFLQGCGLRSDFKDDMGTKKEDDYVQTVCDGENGCNKESNSNGLHNKDKLVFIFSMFSMFLFKIIF